jgi:hypothetical protein
MKPAGSKRAPLSAFFFRKGFRADVLKDQLQ